MLRRSGFSSGYLDNPAISPALWRMLNGFSLSDNQIPSLGYTRSLKQRVTLAITCLLLALTRLRVTVTFLPLHQAPFLPFGLQTMY